MIIHENTAPSAYTIGGKAQGLYRLQAIGIPVPPFLVIPAETFAPHLTGLPPDAVDRRRERLTTFTLSDEDWATILCLLHDLGFPEKPVVVRSSMAGEDGNEHTFAGLMDSFLNLKTPEAVWQAVAVCAASAYSDRAVAYRMQKGLPADARPAVIIQQQVTPVASGVLFTTFPDYPQEMAAHAVYGFGEGLVQGQFDADEFYWLKSTGELHRQRLANKTEQLVAGMDQGLRTEVIAGPVQQQPCLSPSQLATLFETGTRIAEVFGSPQDIEFVVNGEGVFIVQSRPVTQSIPEIIVYDNANIQESYCGVTTPLTFSFASRAYATVYRQTMHALGLPRKTITQQEDIVRNLLGLVKGRIYYNINNWYRGLQLLPSFRQNKADMERMMGLTEPVDFVKDVRKTTGRQLAMLPGLLLNLGRLLWAFSRLDKSIRLFKHHFDAYYARFYQLDLATLPADALWQEKNQLDRGLLGNWSVPIINDFYVMMTNGRVVRQLKKTGFPEPDVFLSSYLSGNKQIASTRPLLAIHRLAITARQDLVLCEAIIRLPEALHEYVRQEHTAFYEQVTQFIHQYGDRTVGELKLETETMRLVPQVFYQYLRNYLLADIPDEPVSEYRSVLHETAAAELADKLKSRPAWHRRRVMTQLSRLQQAIENRELLRLERTRLFGMYRALYIAMGRILTRQGVLTSEKDVFCLTEEEIGQALKNAAPLTRLIRERKDEFRRYEDEEVPGRVVVPSPPVAGKQVAGALPDVWQGTGCVPGIVTGEAIVITDPKDDLNVTGKIVCALRTDPGWAVLFPTCRAVLIEKGSSLSHSVILLRELGLPTVINIQGLTKAVTSGQHLTINGRTGEIRRIHHAGH
nr:PEP/pyruvate-binding domain-containing protein [uncultured Arsenicibacter sp.]